MGQRHQLFVIARAAPGQRYHSLSAVHHQWLYGITALQTCLRLLRIFSDQANRTALQQELAFAAKFFDEEKGRYKTFRRPADPRTAPCPFPFITTCLVLGATVAPERGYSSNVLLETFDMPYDGGDNNDGITVVDISNLDDVRYCFVDFHGMESQRPVPLDTPLTGWDYVRAYYTDEHPMLKDNVSLPTALQGYPLIQKEALEDCWPHGKWQTRKDDDDGGGGEEADAGGGTGSQTSPGHTKSLRGLAQEKLFEALLSDPEEDVVKILEQPGLIHGFKDDLATYLYRHGGRVAQSPAAARLLEWALAGAASVDLAALPDLAPDVVQSLLAKPAFKDVKILNLSGARAAAPAELARTLAALDHPLDELYLLEEPSRSGDDPFAVAQAVREVSQASPVPSSSPVTRKLVIGSAMSSGLRAQSWLLPREARGLETWFDRARECQPVCGAFPVVQLLFEGVNLFRQDVMRTDTYYVGDGLLAPERFVAGLLNIMRTRVLGSVTTINRIGLDVGQCLASAPSSLRALAAAAAAAAVASPSSPSSSSSSSSSSIEVGPIPAEAYIMGRRNHYDVMRLDTVSCCPRDLLPETWTAVVTQHIREPKERRDPDRTRQRVITYEAAMVRARTHIVAQPDVAAPFAEEDLEVVSLEAFLARTTPPASTAAADLGPAVRALQAFLAREEPCQCDAETLLETMSAEHAAEVLRASFASLERKQAMSEY